MLTRQQIIQKISEELSRDITLKLEVVLNKVLTTCLNCKHWSNDANEYCILFNAKPPAKIIVFGCDNYMDIQEIPF